MFDKTMKSFFNWKRISTLVQFCVILVSGVAFSLVLLTGRLFFEDQLKTLINFQSYAVLISFLMQLGLRTELRNQIYKSRYKLVKQVEFKYLYLGVLLTPIFWGMQLFSWFDLPLVFSFLLSFLTMKLGVFLAIGNKYKASIYSVYTFLLIFLGASVVLTNLTGDYKSNIQAVELISSVWMLSIYIYGRRECNRLKLKVFKLVVKSGLQMQYASLLIYLSTFLFAQYTIKLSEQANNSMLLLQFAELTLICGLQVLLASKLIVFYEREIVKRGNYAKVVLVNFCLILLNLLIVVFYYESSDNGNSDYAIVFVLVVLSRHVNAFICQFSKVKYKSLNNKISVVLLAIFLLEYFTLTIKSSSMLILNSYILPIVVLMIISTKKKIFFNAKN